MVSAVGRCHSLTACRKATKMACMHAIVDLTRVYERGVALMDVSIEYCTE